MDERALPSGSSSTAGTNPNATCSAEASSSSRSVTGGNSSTPVLSMSMASVSSEESVEVFPLAEQEEIAALTHDVRIFIESLGKLGRTFNPVDRDKHETMRVAAHDRLGDVLRILRTVLEKYPSLHSTELLMTAGTLIQRVKGYNYEDECLDSKDTLETIDQLALALSSRVSEYVMGDLDANFSLSSSVSSKTKSCENLDSDAESIQDVHIVDKKPDLLSPQEIDSMLLKLEQGVDFALNRAKLWAKYARDVMMYIERRTYLDLEYAKNLSKLAQTFGPSIIAEPNLPLQSIYCSLLENDAANSNANQATCNLVLGNKYLEPLSARRNEHEQSRKKAKELWHRKLTQMHSAISRIREARTSYQYCQLEWEKTREALLRSDPSDQKYEKKRLREDEALQRVGQTRFHLSQHFDAPKGMIFLSDRVKPGIGGGIFPGRKTNLSPGTFPRGESIEQPAWLAFDNQILTFNAYFQETAQERDGYNHNIRPCKIFFYPQDGTMLVTEPKTENSGMSQGTLLSRHRIPYPAPKDSEFYNILDLNIGREIEIYGRFFKIVNCDLFTRNYLNRCGIPVPDPIDMPVDPYSKLRIEKEGKKYAKHPTHTVHKLRQFLRYDRQVLSFKAFWDDRRREGGFVHLLKVNYYLCDDTIEIFEIFAPGLSQESGSTFLGKCKLPKVLESEIGYKACIVDANEKRIQLLKTKTEVVQKTRELILESDAVIKTATVAYFQGQYNLTSMWPHQVKTLCDRSKLYEPGSQYMEFVKRLQPNQTKETAALPFSFDPVSNSETSQVLGKERKSTDSLDSEDLLCENFYLIDSARSVRNVQDTNSFRNAHLNTTCWCRECGLYVDSQTVNCSEKCTRAKTLSCGHKLPLEKMSTFGVDLAQHLAETRSSVPQILCKCVEHIAEKGKLIKGIYRLSGVKSKVEKLCQEFERGAESVDLTDAHPNVVASVLKLYLRQLPEPLLTFQLYSDFIQIAKDCPTGSDVDNELQFVTQLTEIVNKLPRAHYMTASHLIKHMEEVAASSAVNHMPASNLGIVFGPTLLRTVEGSTSLSSLVDTIHQARVVELLVSHAGEIFGSKSGKSCTSLSHSSTSLYPTCEIVEISSTQSQPEENTRDQDSSQPTSKEQSYELTSDEELSYFLLADQSSCLKASSSTSTPKIFQGSLKDYQGLEGVSLTLLGDMPPERKSLVQEKLRKTVSASSVDAWHYRPQPQKPRIESLGGKPELSRCTGSSADSEYSLEFCASSSESTDVFVDPPSEMSHSLEVQGPAEIDSQKAGYSKQKYSAYIPVYQTHSDSTEGLNTVHTKSMVSETKVIQDLLKRQFLNYKEVKISVPHMRMESVQSSFKNTSFNGRSSIQTNADVQMEANTQSKISTASADIEPLEIPPDECEPYVSFENDKSLGEEHSGC